MSSEFDKFLAKMRIRATFALLEKQAGPPPPKPVLGASVGPRPAVGPKGPAGASGPSGPAGASGPAATPAPASGVQRPPQSQSGVQRPPQGQPQRSMAEDVAESAPVQDAYSGISRTGATQEAVQRGVQGGQRAKDLLRRGKGALNVVRRGTRAGQTVNLADRGNRLTNMGRRIWAGTRQFGSGGRHVRRVAGAGGRALSAGGKALGPLGLALDLGMSSYSGDRSKNMWTGPLEAAGLMPGERGGTGVNRYAQRSAQEGRDLWNKGINPLDVGTTLDQIGYGLNPTKGAYVAADKLGSGMASGIDYALRGSQREDTGEDALNRYQGAVWDKYRGQADNVQDQMGSWTQSTRGGGSLADRLGLGGRRQAQYGEEGWNPITGAPVQTLQHTNASGETKSWTKGSPGYQKALERFNSYPQRYKQQMQSSLQQVRDNIARRRAELGR